MNEYNFNIDRWYIFNNVHHGKLDAGLYHITPHNIEEWFDTYNDYVLRCNELNITPVEQ